ncbi:alpha/beta hydrolase [Saccharopolyspora taberi]|uniref:Alpha/beta hydrolase n=1 Tax=Saccharopolyspora taberi TaxID=60895 RepID=A0ABN3VAW5_9PSEU
MTSARTIGIRALAALWALVIISPAVVFLPVLPEWAALVSGLVTTWSPLMVVPALIGVVLAVVARRLEMRRMFAAVAVGVVLSLLAAVVPLVAGMRTAAENDVALSVPGYFSSPPTPTGPHATEVYATVDGEQLKLDVWRPAKPAPGNPAIVWAHGGGFVLGHRGQAPDRNQWLTDHGYTVFDVDYRLSPPPRWDQQARDVKCAVGWVAQRAGQYGIGAVSVGGDSAGANLALLAAYTTGTGAYPPSCDVPEQRPKSVVAYYPPTDMPELHRTSGLPGVVDQVEAKYYGGTPETMPAEFRASSPVTYVRPGLPPTLLVHGANDHLVPAGQSAILRDRLAAAGVLNREVVVPWADHAFDLKWGSWPTQIAYGVLAQFLLG